jgi:hypothetical protein
MEGNMDELKQIGPRIRPDVADALKEYAAKRRMSMSLIVELAVIDLLKQSGYAFDDSRD